MYPRLFRVPLPWGNGFTIASYGFMIMCGFLLVLYIARRRAPRLGLDPEAVFDTAIAMLLGGLVGARLFYVVYDWPEFRDNPLRILYIWEGGLIFFGGLIGGAVFMLITVRRRKLPLLRALDLLVSLLPLGHAFGRFGCFLNGCCFGRVTQSWIGVRFPRILSAGEVDNPLYNVDGQHVVGSPVFVHHWFSGDVLKSELWSLPIHPTQLYAVGYNLVIFAVLSLMFWRRRREGDIVFLYAVLYGVARFTNEFLRNDQGPALFGLTIAQLICIPLFVFGVAMLVRSMRRQREPLPEPWQPPAPAESENA